MDHPPGVGIPGYRRGDRGEIGRRSREELPTIKGIREAAFLLASCLLLLASSSWTRAVSLVGCKGEGQQKQQLLGLVAKSTHRKRKTPTTTEKNQEKTTRGYYDGKGRERKGKERSIRFPFPC